MSVSAQSPSAPAASECAGSGSADAVQIPEVVEGKFNVAMVLIGPHDDGGWSQAHYEGLQYVCENVPDTHVAYVELVPRGRRLRAGVPEPGAQGLRLHHRHLVRLHGPHGHGRRGVPGHDVPAPDRATSSNGTNFGNFFGAMEDFKYLAGMLAGSRAKLDGNPKLGYMATFPIPEEIRLGNAIMLGAKQTCPECTMDVRFINTWHDPVKETRRRRLAVRRGRAGRVHGRGHARRRGRSPRRRASGASPTTTPPPASSTRASRRPTGSGARSTPASRSR